MPALARLGRRLGWTRPVAWLGRRADGVRRPPCSRSRSCPALRRGVARARPRTLRGARAGRWRRSARRSTARGPVIPDFPIWLAETQRVPALALPDETAGGRARPGRHRSAPRWLIVAKRRPRRVAGGPRRRRRPGRAPASTRSTLPVPADPADAARDRGHPRLPHRLRGRGGRRHAGSLPSGPRRRPRRGYTPPDGRPSERTGGHAGSTSLQAEATEALGVHREHPPRRPRPLPRGLPRGPRPGGRRSRDDLGALERETAIRRRGPRRAPDGDGPSRWTRPPRPPRPAPRTCGCGPGPRRGRPLARATWRATRRSSPGWSSRSATSRRTWLFLERGDATLVTEPSLPDDRHASSRCGSWRPRRPSGRASPRRSTTGRPRRSPTRSSRSSSSSASSTPTRAWPGRSCASCASCSAASWATSAASSPSSGRRSSTSSAWTARSSTPSTTQAALSGLHDHDATSTAPADGLTEAAADGRPARRPGGAAECAQARRRHATSSSPRALADGQWVLEVRDDGRGFDTGSGGGPRPAQLRAAVHA